MVSSHVFESAKKGLISLQESKRKSTTFFGEKRKHPRGEVSGGVVGRRRLRRRIPTAVAAEDDAHQRVGHALVRRQSDDVVAAGVVVGGGTSAALLFLHLEALRPLAKRVRHAYGIRAQLCQRRRGRHIRANMLIVDFRVIARLHQRYRRRR